jgi:hypothetical protein
MGLTFPTRHNHYRRGGMASPGTPERASHCRCKGGPVIDSRDPSCPTCINCGKFPRPTIDATWQQRAEEIDRRKAA